MAPKLKNPEPVTIVLRDRVLNWLDRFPAEVDPDRRLFHLLRAFQPDDPTREHCVLSVSRVAQYCDEHDVVFNIQSSTLRRNLSELAGLPLLELACYRLHLD